MKRIVSLYLEADVIDRLKRDGVNISELVGKFLHDFTKPPATPADIAYQAQNFEIKAAELRVQADKARKAIEEAEAMKSKLLEDPYMKEVMARVRASPGTIEANLRAVKNKLGVVLNVKEFQELMDREEKNEVHNHAEERKE